MKHAGGDNGEFLFRKVLIVSLIVYFAVVLVTILTPFNTASRRSLKKTVSTPIEIHLNSTTPPQLSEEIKRRLAEEKKKREEALKKLLEEKRLAEERQKREEREQLEKEKKRAEEQKRLEEERRRREEAKRLEDEKQRAEEERKRAEEEQRLAKEKNKEVARNSGLLKAMQGRGKSADNLVNTEEIGNVIAQSQVKSPKPQQGGQATGATATQRPALKGSGGIGNAVPGIAKAQPGSLSGQRTVTGRDVVPPGKEGASPFAKSTLRQTRSQESIREVIKSHRGSLDFAYRKALRSDPTLKGVITIEFTLSPDGAVINARIVSSTVTDPSFEEDVLKRVKTWKFPAYPDSGNTIVTYPIEFSPA